MFWGRRGGHDNRPIPIDADPNVSGHYLVSGFVMNQYGTAIVPQMSDARDALTIVPDWEQIPEWARKKRWTNHAEFCEELITASVMLFGGNPPSKPTAAPRVGLSEGRRRYVDELLGGIRRALQGYVPSERFQEACDDYAGMKIDKQRFERAVHQEDARLRQR
jgi:hypothetical protein